MTSNLASDEIAKYGLRLREEAEIISKTKVNTKEGIIVQLKYA